MGAVVSWFRRKKATRTVLEEIEDKIKFMEKKDVRLEQQKRAVVSSMILFIVGIYVISAVVYYKIFRPFKVVDVLLYALAVITFTIVMLFLRNALFRFYNWRLGKNKQKLTEVRAEKKRILEEVMENEVYKVAKELLATFGDPQEKPPEMVTPVKSIVSGPMTPAQLRQRNNSKMLATPSSTPISRLTHNATLTPMPMPLQVSPMQSTPLHGDLLPRPLLSGGPGGGGGFDKLVDYLIGDGPSRRYALICSKCNGHNGMALPEEFEYVTYWCAYCRHLNLAKKQKPKPPPLEGSPNHRLNNLTAIHHRNSDSSDSDDAPEGDFHFRSSGPKTEDKSVETSNIEKNEDPAEDSEQPSPSAPPAEEVEASDPKDSEAKKED